MSDATMFQVVSRNNDRNGNPYRLMLVYNRRLMLVYNRNGNIVELYEARSSMPNYIRVLEQRNLIRLVSFHLSPSEYNETKAAYKELLQHVD